MENIKSSKTESAKKKQYNKAKQSGLMKLLVAYKTETDEEKKALLKKKLKDEMSIFVYTYGLNHPLIRSENASSLLLETMKNFDKFIDEYNIEKNVDFAYYFKRVIAMMGKAFFNAEKRDWVNSGVSFSFMIPEILIKQEENYVSEEALSPYKTINAYKIKDDKKKEMQELLKKKHVQNYILSSSLLLDDDTLSSIVNNLPIDDRLDFVEKYLQLKTMYDEKRPSTFSERTIKHLVRKRQVEGDEEKETRVSHQRYNELVRRNQKKNILSYKPSYEDLEKVCLKSHSNIASSLSLGKHAIIDYKKRKKDERHEIYTSEFKSPQAL